MKRFTSFGSTVGGGNKKKKDKSPSAAGSHGGHHQATIDPDSFNELEMLRAENAHLKRLIEQRDEQESSDGGKETEGGRASARAAAELATLRNQRDQLQRQLFDVTEHLSSVQRDYHNLQRDRQMEVEELQRKARTLDAQIEYLDRQHQQELQEKDARIRELEMKVVDLEQEIEIAQRPAAAASSNRRDDLESDGPEARIADLEKRLQLARAEAQRRAEEAERLREELDALRAKGFDEGSVAALQAERDYLRVQLEEAEARARSYQSKAEELDEQLERLSAELHKKHELINNLETQIGELRLQAARREASDRRETDASPTGGNSVDISADTAQEVDELKKQLKEKEKAVWDLSDRLLQMSAECDRLQETQRQQQQQQQGEAGGGAETTTDGGPGSVILPSTPTGSLKKDKRPRTAVLEDNQRLILQIQQLQEDIKKQQQEGEARQRAAQQRIVEMEKRAAELEKNLFLENQNLQNAQEKLQQIQKRREAELAALEVSKESRARALEVARTVVLPLQQPHGEENIGGSEEESTASSSREDLQVELALKSAALRSLSVKNAHLNDVLQRLRMTSTAEYAERQIEICQQELKQTQDRLAEREREVCAAKAKETQLQGQIARLKAEAELSQKDAAESREALRDAQARHSAAADRFKHQNEEYARLLTQAMAEADRLGGELACARVERMEAVKRLREEARAWRADAIKQCPFSVSEKDNVDSGVATESAALVSGTVTPRGTRSTDRQTAAAQRDTPVTRGRQQLQQLVPVNRRRRLQHRCMLLGKTSSQVEEGGGGGAVGRVPSESSSTPEPSDATNDSVVTGESGRALELMLPPSRPLPIPEYMEYVVQSAAAGRGSQHTVVAPVEVCAVEEMHQWQRDTSANAGMTTSTSALSFFAYPSLADSARSPAGAAARRPGHAVGGSPSAIAGGGGSGSGSAACRAVSGRLWNGAVVAEGSRRGGGGKRVGRGDGPPYVTPEIQRAAAQYLREYVELQQQQQYGKREVANSTVFSVPPSSPRFESVSSVEGEDEERENEANSVHRSSPSPRARVLPPPSANETPKRKGGTAKIHSPISIVSKLFPAAPSKKTPPASSPRATASRTTETTGVADTADNGSAGPSRVKAEASDRHQPEQRLEQQEPSTKTEEKTEKASAPKVSFHKVAEETASDVIPYPTFSFPATGSSETLSAAITATFGSPRDYDAPDADAAEGGKEGSLATLHVPAATSSSDTAVASFFAPPDATEVSGRTAASSATPSPNATATSSREGRARGRSLDLCRDRSAKTIREMSETTATAGTAKQREDDELNLR